MASVSHFIVTAGLPSRDPHAHFAEGKTEARGSWISGYLHGGRAVKGGFCNHLPHSLHRPPSCREADASGGPPGIAGPEWAAASRTRPLPSQGTLSLCPPLSRAEELTRAQPLPERSR